MTSLIDKTTTYNVYNIVARVWHATYIWLMYATPGVNHVHDLSLI